MDKVKRIGIDMRMAGDGFGLGRYIVELAKALLKRKSEFEYVLFFDKNFNESTFRTFQKFHNQNKLVNAKYYTLEEQIKMPGILRKEKLDLVHFPNFNTPILYTGKFVVTIHDLIHHRFPGKKRRNFLHRLSYRYIIKQAVRNADKIIAVSQSTKDDIINLLDVESKKIEVVHEGIADNFTGEVDIARRTATLQKYNITKPYILAVSEWRRYKNLDFLIRAFLGSGDEILEKYNLVVCGKIDPNYPEVGRTLDQANKDRVIAVGKVPEQDLVDLYSGARCFVSPSLVEGFGLTYLEAQGNQLPILASDIPVANEILGNSAFFFNPRDIKDLISKLNRLLSNEDLRADLIAKGRVNLQRFSWEITARQTEEIYRNILSQ